MDLSVERQGHQQGGELEGRHTQEGVEGGVAQGDVEVAVLHHALEVG